MVDIHTSNAAADCNTVRLSSTSSSTDMVVMTSYKHTIVNIHSKYSAVLTWSFVHSQSVNYMYYMCMYVCMELSPALIKQILSWDDCS